MPRACASKGQRDVPVGRWRARRQHCCRGPHQGQHAGSLAGTARTWAAHRHGHRRQRTNGTCRCGQTGHRRGPWGCAPRRQGSVGGTPQTGRQTRRDGRRRHQRCASPRRRRCRHRDGNRHRRGHVERPGHAGEGRPAWDRPRESTLRSGRAQHATEPGVRLRLQRPGRASGGGRAGAVRRTDALADARRTGDEPQLGLGGRQCTTPATRACPATEGHAAAPGRPPRSSRSLT